MFRVWRFRWDEKTARWGGCVTFEVGTCMEHKRGDKLSQRKLEYGAVSGGLCYFFFSVRRVLTAFSGVASMLWLKARWRISWNNSDLPNLDILGILPTWRKPKELNLD
jgi:hypothetical protein